MSPPAIVTAFNEKLPVEPLVVFASNVRYRSIRSSASSTINTDPVPVYLEEAVDTYRNLSERHFPRIGHASPLSSRMPVLEQTHRLETEADVLRLATLQLIHPVNIALQEICPPGTRIFCRAETSTDGTSCFDVEWSLYDIRGTHLSRLAVLEVKNTNVVHKDDFRRAARREKLPVEDGDGRRSI